MCLYTHACIQTLLAQPCGQRKAQIVRDDITETDDSASDSDASRARDKPIHIRPRPDKVKKDKVPATIRCCRDLAACACKYSI